MKIDDVTPVFIVGSGRNGSELLYRLLRECHNVRAHHEYMVHYVQPLACQLAMGLIDSLTLEALLESLFVPALVYSDREIWVDSCNKCSWMIAQLNNLFPNAKFVFLMRDGRRVVTSYYHKLSEECYAERDIAILRDWAWGGRACVPPPEKRYWWPLPYDSSNYDRWTLLCWYWDKIMKTIVSQLSIIPAERIHVVRLEDFVSDIVTFEKLFSFLDLLADIRLFELAQKPINVRQPISFQMTNEQQDVFWSICGTTMANLGYYGPDYAVSYVQASGGQSGEKIFSY